VVHGIVELTDGSMLMHAAVADMGIPIQMALLYDVDEVGASFGSLDLAHIGELTFEELDRARFPAVDLAYEAARKGETYPAVLNAANEVAVEAFLARRLRFLDIVGVVSDVLAAHDPTPAHDLDAVIEADLWARSRAEDIALARALTLTGGPS
jgi:1-deoxy-D-xylulose-5-phosphate reductoisomerase